MRLLIIALITVLSFNASNACETHDKYALPDTCNQDAYHDYKKITQCMKDLKKKYDYIVFSSEADNNCQAHPSSCFDDTELLIAFNASTNSWYKRMQELQNTN